MESESFYSSSQDDNAYKSNVIARNSKKPKKIKSKFSQAMDTKEMGSVQNKGLLRSRSVDFAIANDATKEADRQLKQK